VPDGLRLALTTLTVAPVRAPEILDRRTAGRAMTCAPLVGLLLGLVATAVLIGFEHLSSAPLAAVLAIATLAFLTRGLHLDGLADTADGLGSYLPAERARAVMKQPDVGALGLVTVLFVVAVQVAALLACVDGGRGGESLLLAVVTGRVAVTAACTRRTPAATATGLGALVAGTVATWAALALIGLTVVAALIVGLLTDAGGVAAGFRAVAAVTGALLVAEALRRHAVRRLGGITGDVLGALVEVTTAVVLVVMAVG